MDLVGLARQEFPKDLMVQQVQVVQLDQSSRCLQLNQVVHWVQAAQGVHLAQGSQDFHLVQADPMVPKGPADRTDPVAR